MIVSKKKLTILALSIMAVLCAVLFAAGCSAGLTIGEEREGALSFLLTNGLERSVTSLSVKTPTAEKYESALPQESELEVGTAATVFVPDVAELAATGEADAAPTEADSSMPEAPANAYDIKVQTTGGTVYELHWVDLADVSNATLKAEGELGYLEYTSIATGAEVSTLQDEKDYRQAVKDAEEAAKAEAERQAAEEAAAKEEAERKAAEETAAKEEAERKAAEEEAARQAAEEEARRNESASRPSSSGSSSGASGSSSSGGGSSSSSGGGSSEDEACADDLLFND